MMIFDILDPILLLVTRTAILQAAHSTWDDLGGGEEQVLVIRHDDATG
jgi:hypothetical protein